MPSPGKPKPTPASSPPIEFTVRGTPAPKGSATAFVVKNKASGKLRAVVVQGGATGSTGRERLKGWDSAVREAAAAAIGQGRTSTPFVAVPLRVDIEFRLVRPRSHYGSGRKADVLKPGAPPFPFGKPDRDKLERTTLDAMSGIIFDDDSRVVAGETSKVWARPGEEGARIRIADHTANGETYDWRGAVMRLVHVTCQGVYAGMSDDHLWSKIDNAVMFGEINRDERSKLERDAAVAKARARDRIRASVDGSLFAAESHAMRKHGPRPISTGKLCEVCNAPTPYTDWTRCEKHNGCNCSKGGGFVCTPHLDIPVEEIRETFRAIAEDPDPDDFG